MEAFFIMIALAVILPLVLWRVDLWHQRKAWRDATRKAARMLHDEDRT